MPEDTKSVILTPGTPPNIKSVANFVFNEILPERQWKKCYKEFRDCCQNCINAFMEKSQILKLELQLYLRVALTRVLFSLPFHISECWDTIISSSKRRKISRSAV